MDKASFLSLAGSSGGSVADTGVKLALGGDAGTWRIENGSRASLVVIEAAP